MPRPHLVIAAGVLAAALAVAIVVIGVPAVTILAAGRTAPTRAAPARLVSARPGGDPLARCEQRLERRRDPDPPRLAIVGASYTAGVGPGRASASWADLLARRLHWDGVVDGVPGTGYVHSGHLPGGASGPVRAELARIGLARLRPGLVIVQAGHDDSRVPLAAERRQVAATLHMIRAEAPGARIALLTVFTRGRPSAAAVRLDRAIAQAAEAADPGVIIMDPLTGRWVFPRARDGLHPSAAGSAWLARRVAALLAAHGVDPVRPQPGELVCDSGIPAGTGSPGPRAGPGRR